MTEVQTVRIFLCVEKFNKGLKMLKIEVNKVKKEKKPELPKYPYFGEFVGTDGRVVVLFIRSRSGMAVETDNKNWKMFEICHSIIEDKFKKIDNYSITISTIN